MRIVSTVACATEIVCKLGLSDSLVGISYGCDYPPEIRSKPIVVESTLPKNLSSREIHELISSAKRDGKNYFRIRYDLISELRPDIVIFHGTCDVCAVQPQQLNMFFHTHEQFNTLTLTATNIEGILNDIRVVGYAMDRIDEADKTVNEIKRRLGQIRMYKRKKDENPRVAFLEWIDPPIIAGHWIPEMIEMIGGKPVLGTSDEPSRVITWKKIADADPDVIIFGPCGFHVIDSLKEMRNTKPAEVWSSLKAVRNRQVWVVEASHYFSRPGPRFVHGIEILHDILWGTRLFSDDIEIEPFSLASPWLEQST